MIRGVGSRAWLLVAGMWLGAWWGPVWAQSAGPAKVQLSFQSRLLPALSHPDHRPLCRVWVVDRGDRSLLVERSVASKEWDGAVADLSPWAGRWIEMSLEVASDQPLQEGLAVAWRGVRVEVNTGERPEPTADLLGLACWGMPSPSQGAASGHAISLSEWPDPAGPVPILSMEIPAGDLPLVTSLRLPVWVPDSLPGALPEWTPLRRDDRQGTSIDRKALSSVVFCEKGAISLTEARSQISWGLGLPGIPGIWARQSSTDRLDRSPASISLVRRTGSSLRLAVETAAGAPRRLGILDVRLLDPTSARLSFVPSREPGSEGVTGIDLLGWLRQDGGQGLSVLASPLGGQIISSLDVAPWASYGPQRDLPLLLAYGGGGSVCVDWDEAGGAILGPLGPFGVEDAGVRAILSKQLGFSIFLPMTESSIDVRWFPGRSDWLSACLASRGAVTARWGQVRPSMRQPHVFLGADSESLLDGGLFLKPSPLRQWGQRPVIVDLREDQGGGGWGAPGKRLDFIEGASLAQDRLLWEEKKPMARNAIGSDGPFEQGQKVRVWAGPGWSPATPATVPFMDLVAGQSWVILSHPGESMGLSPSMGLLGDLLLGRPVSLFLAGEEALELDERPTFERVDGSSDRVLRSSILSQPWAGSAAGWTVGEFILSIPQGPCWLRGYTGIADEALNGDGVAFRASVDGQVLFERRHTERAWAEFDVDVSAWAGMDVCLALAVGPGPEGDAAHDWALWGEARLEDEVGHEIVNFCEKASSARVSIRDESLLAGRGRVDEWARLESVMEILGWTAQILRDHDLIAWTDLPGGGVSADYEGDIHIVTSGTATGPVSVKRGVLGQPGFSFESPKGVALLVKEWDGRLYGQDTLFWMRTLDGKPCLWSKRVMVSRVQGDSVVRIKSFRAPQSVQSGEVMSTGEGWYDLRMSKAGEVTLK